MEDEIENMNDDDLRRMQMPDLHFTESPIIDKTKGEIRESQEAISNFYGVLNTSIGTILSSSFQSNNMQTVTLSSMDS